MISKKNRIKTKKNQHEKHIVFHADLRSSIK